MRADLEKLKQFITPATKAQALDSVRAYESSAEDNATFVHAVESELRGEVLGRAQAILRAEAAEQAERQLALG